MATGVKDDSNPTGDGSRHDDQGQGSDSDDEPAGNDVDEHADTTIAWATTTTTARA